MNFEPKIRPTTNNYASTMQNECTFLFRQLFWSICMLQHLLCFDIDGFLDPKKKIAHSSKLINVIHRFECCWRFAYCQETKYIFIH